MCGGAENIAFRVWIGRSNAADLYFVPQEVRLMRSLFRTAASGVVAAAAIIGTGSSSPARAHHGGGVEYFMEQTLGPITGTVTLFSFSFPHPYVQFDVKDAKGNVQKWSAVMQLTPTRLRARGWSQASIKPGDTMTVTYSPHRTAPNVGFARRIEINGKFLDEGV
jgi:hypothetical protein